MIACEGALSCSYSDEDEAGFQKDSFTREPKSSGGRESTMDRGGGLTAGIGERTFDRFGADGT